MATTTNAFNDMMQQFLDELVLTFPTEKKLVKYQNTFSILRKANPKKPLKEFMIAVSPFATHLMQKDEEFFKTHAAEVPFLNDLDIPRLWSSDLTDVTKGAIWQYLQTLYILGTTINSLPAETLSMIESVAQKCASQLQGDATSPDGTINEEALMNSMNGLMSSLLKGGKGGPLI
jgi:hypothetical protein